MQKSLDFGTESKKQEENKTLEKWIKEKKLTMLLRYGCDKDKDNYTLSGLDLRKLLEISPEAASSESLLDIIESMKFVRIPSGEFNMGSLPDNQGMWRATESPVQEVIIKNPFSMSKCPITQKQWIALMGYNPSQFKGEERPVENVSWDDVQKFIKKLNETDNTSQYRLPSEAEWEYACRAGTTTEYYFGDNESELGNYAWYSENSGSETHPVGLKKPNGGFYDMHGNVWEWCQDKWHANYNGTPSDGSPWEAGSSSSRVIRGGGWNSNPEDCRSALRDRFVPADRGSNLGFRLLRNP